MRKDKRFSDEVVLLNGGHVEGLIAGGYMSPQAADFVGEGFSCNRCDYYNRKEGFCLHPTIASYVEYNGCSNKFTINHVRTEK